MQEEIEQKSFNLMISTTKLSARTVLRAIKAALLYSEERKTMTAQCPKKDITIAWIMITHGHLISLPQIIVSTIYGDIL